jgi:hypothetical protein
VRICRFALVGTGAVGLTKPDGQHRDGPRPGSLGASDLDRSPDVCRHDLCHKAQEVIVQLRQSDNQLSASHFNVAQKLWLRAPIRLVPNTSAWSPAKI